MSEFFKPTQEDGADKTEKGYAQVQFKLDTSQREGVFLDIEGEEALLGKKLTVLALGGWGSPLAKREAQAVVKKLEEPNTQRRIHDLYEKKLQLDEKLRTQGMGVEEIDTLYFPSSPLDTATELDASQVDDETYQAFISVREELTDLRNEVNAALRGKYWGKRYQG